MLKESSFQKIKRERKKNEAKGAADAKQKILDDSKEKNHMESIIKPIDKNGKFTKKEWKTVFFTSYTFKCYITLIFSILMFF